MSEALFPRVVLIAGLIAVWVFAQAVAGQAGGESAGAGSVPASWKQLAQIDDDARKAFGPSAATTCRSVLQSVDTVFVAYATVRSRK